MTVNRQIIIFFRSSSDECAPGDPISAVITKLQLEANKYVESQHNSKTAEYVTQKSTHPNQRIPVLIDWTKRCSGLISDFQIIPSENLPVVPSCSQESIVVNDLILCLQGISGRYIVANPLQKGKRTFVVNDQLDACWIHLANNILPVAAYYSTLTRFVEEKKHFQYGKVSIFFKLKNFYLIFIMFCVSR